MLHAFILVVTCLLVCTPIASADQKSEEQRMLEELQALAASTKPKAEAEQANQDRTQFRHLVAALEANQQLINEIEEKFAQMETNNEQVVSTAKYLKIRQRRVGRKSTSN